jgi:hypothetical protein
MFLSYNLQINIFYYYYTYRYPRWAYKFGSRTGPGTTLLSSAGNVKEVAEARGA